MIRFSQFLLERTTKAELDQLENFADRLLNKFGIDIEFTKHFAERLDDPRNKPGIDLGELRSLFKKIEKAEGSRILNMKDAEAVLKDLQSDLNLPFVIKIQRDGDKEVRFKTIMRKKKFLTHGKTITY